MKTPKLIVLTGPTATGKTRLAVSLAKQLNGAIISADSRQVYKSMDIGTGKDLEEYGVGAEIVPYYLIDIKKAGEKYTLFDFQKDFIRAFEHIIQQGKVPILCGGTGLYISAILDKLPFVGVPVNEPLRTELTPLATEALIHRLNTLPPIPNFLPDLSTRKRVVRAIEILTHCQDTPFSPLEFPDFTPLIFGIQVPAHVRRERISHRLQHRFNHGLIEEVQSLVRNGIPHETLEYYGLEYKFVSQFLKGQLDRNTTFLRLETAIHQFAKRQMTWFRKMEREGKIIEWIDGLLTPEEQLEQLLDRLH